MTQELKAATGSEAAQVALLAQQAAEVRPVEPGAVYATLGTDGEIVFRDADAWMPFPRHTTGSRVVTDAASFVAYVNRHKLPGTEVFADTPHAIVVAVIDSHEGSVGDPGWQRHKLTLSLEHTKAWKAWTVHDLVNGAAAWFGQQEFAEFIEDRALDVVDPDHATLIELATRFEATKSVEFEQATRLDTGEVQFQYKETVGPRKGAKGDVRLPKEIKLALRPYIGGPIYFIYASFRYRIHSEGLRLGYTLQRPEAILDGAFADIVAEIRDGRTDKDAETKEETFVHAGIGPVPIFYGRP